MTTTHRSGASGEFIDETGVSRRTIVAGAAWTIPAVAVATATPAVAATTDLKLAFDKSSYSGEACKTVSGVKVTATRNGAAAPGESVTVTLADGYTFSDGSTSHTATTGSDGSITLPDITVPAKGGDSAMSATSGNAAASAALQAASDAGDLWRSDTGKKTGAKNVAQVFTDGTGSVYAITASGDLVDSGGGVVASGLDSSNMRVAAVAKTTNDGGTAVFYIKDGDLYRSDTGKKTGATGVAQVFTDGTGSVYAVTKSGDLVQSDGGVVASGLDSSNTRVAAIAPTSNNGDTAVFYIKDGDLYRSDTGKKTGATNVAQVFTDGTGSVYAVTKSGDLVDSGGSVVDSGLDSSNTRVAANAKTTNDGGTAIFYVKDGNIYRSDTKKKTGATNVSQVFTDGTGSVYAVTKSGDLVNSGGSVAGSGLKASNPRVAAIAPTSNDGNTAVFYIKEATC